MKLLVLGAGGFIGNRFNELFGSEFDIVPAAGNSKSNHHDLTKYGRVLSLLDEYRPDAVLNLAGTSYHKTQDDAVIFRSNALIQLNLHEAVKQLKIGPKLILCGSSSVYESSLVPVTELSHCLPLNSYAESKFLQERVALSYAPEQSVIIARIFNVIGPFQSNNFFIPTVIEKVLAFKSGKTPVITLKTLGPMRDFIYIDDVCSALACLLKQGVDGQIYNVCSGDGVKISTVINIIGRILNIEELPVETESDSVESGVDYQVGSNKKMRVLGWCPAYDLKNSLKEIIAKQYGQ